MGDALWFVGSTATGLALFGWIFWRAAKYDRKRQKRVDTILNSIMARPPLLVWITRDTHGHTKVEIGVSPEEALQLLDDAYDAVRFCTGPIHTVATAAPDREDGS